METRFEGEVVSWENGFGLIIYRDKISRRIYFVTRCVRGDWRGSRSWVASRVPVSFTISRRKNTKTGVEEDFAADVAPIFPMSDVGNLQDYREVSEVRSKHFNHVFLTRSCGDQIFLHRNDVVNDQNRWDFLIVGSPVWHGVVCDDNGKWRACNAELYSYEELYEFQHESEPEVAVEPVSEPESEPVSVLVEPTTQSELLRPENKNKSLLNLILERSLVRHTR